MFNGPKLIITYYFYLCVVALVSWAEMFHLAGAIAEHLRYFRKTTKNKLFHDLPKLSLVFQRLLGTLAFFYFKGTDHTIMLNFSRQSLAED